jgi:hypothetical protein
MSMKVRTYLLIAVSIFIAVVTGSDLIARMTIVGSTLEEALEEHMRWASLTLVGIAFLFAPFGVSALICGTANRRANTRSAAVLFFIALGTLAYFYFGGFQASQYAMLDKRWTAAALSIGLLPFFVGLPLVVGVAIGAAAITRFDRRSAVQTLG